MSLRVSDREGRGGGSEGNGDRDSFARRMLDAQPDALYAFDPDGTFLEWNRRVPEMTGYTDEEIAGMGPLDFVPEDDREAVAAAIEQVFRTGGVRTIESAIVTKDGERIPHEFAGSRVLDGDGNVVALTGSAREITDRRAREAELRRGRDELETLDRINALTQEIIGALVEATDREDIERTVCERLSASELYRFAWIGEPEIGDEGVRFRTSAGIDDAFLRDLFEETVEDVARPAVRAIESGRMQVIEDIRDEPSIGPEHRERAYRRDIVSGVAVPLRYGRTIYGALVVAADRPKGFSERERTAFDVLGDVVSFAIHAVKQRHLLLSDTVTELEFRLTDGGSYFTDLSARLDCSVRLDGMVPVSDDAFLYYLTFEDVDPAAVERRVAESEHVEDWRLISDLGNECQFELLVTGGSPALTLAEYGATVRSARSDRGEGTVVAEVLPTEDIRGIVERFRSVYPDSELVAKREVERTSHTTQEFRQVLATRLTDRQRAVLQVAYFAGYYEWPRGSTAEELASAMGISSPTFHQHLRAAQRKLLTTFFREGTDDPS